VGGFDHRFGQLENLDCASQAPLHPGYAGYLAALSLNVVPSVSDLMKAVVEGPLPG